MRRRRPRRRRPRVEVPARVETDTVASAWCSARAGAGDDDPAVGLIATALAVSWPRVGTDTTFTSTLPPDPKPMSGEPSGFRRVTAMSVSPGLANAKPASTILPSG